MRCIYSVYICSGCAGGKCAAHTEWSVCAGYCLCAHAPHIQSGLYVRGIVCVHVPLTYRVVCMCGALSVCTCAAHTEWSVCAAHVHTDSAA